MKKCSPNGEFLSSKFEFKITLIFNTTLSWKSLTQHDNLTETRPEITERNQKPTQNEPISTQSPTRIDRLTWKMLFFNFKQI